MLDSMYGIFLVKGLTLSTLNTLLVTEAKQLNICFNVTKFSSRRIFLCPCDRNPFRLSFTAQDLDQELLSHNVASQLTLMQNTLDFGHCPLSSSNFKFIADLPFGSFG